FTLLGDGPAIAVGEAEAVMRIETALAIGSMTRVERRDPKSLDHLMSTADLQKLAPEFQWQAFFAKAGTSTLNSLNVASPGYFKALNEELNKESLDDWKAYFRWHVAHSYAPYLSSAFVNEDFAFFGKTLAGNEQLRPRWKRCTDYIDDDLG